MRMVISGRRKSLDKEEIALAIDLLFQFISTDGVCHYNFLDPANNSEKPLEHKRALRDSAGCYSNQNGHHSPSNEPLSGSSTTYGIENENVTPGPSLGVAHKRP